MDQLEDSALPASLRRLWGLDRGRAGSTRRLSLDRVVAAAIELADTEGISALSMARLADRLGRSRCRSTGMSTARTTCWLL